jgi:integrase
VFAGFAASRLRTAIARACRAAAVQLFSPHDLRHRRISLLHLGWSRGRASARRRDNRSLAVAADTYTHLLADEA